MTYRLLLLCLCIFCLEGSTVSHAQNSASLKYKKYTTADGLAHNLGFEITQSEDGFIWIGTDDGLSRFDGYEFINFSEEQGLKNQYVICLDEAKDGTIHIGTYGGGHHIMNKDTIWQPKDDSPSRVNRLDVLKDGSILIDMGKPGDSRLYLKKKEDSTFLKVYFFEDEGRVGYFYWKEARIAMVDYLKAETKNGKKNIVVADRNDGVQVYDFQVVDEETICITTNMGVYQFYFQHNNATTDALLSIPELSSRNIGVYHLLKKEERLPNHEFYSIAKESLGNLWFAGPGVIAMLPKNGDQVRVITKNLPQKNISRFVISEKGKAFLATSNSIVAAQKADLYVYDINTSVLSNLNAQLDLKSAISYLFIDREDNLWISTHGSGLYCVFSQNIQNYTIEDGLSNSFVQAILERRDGSIWISTQNGLNIFRNTIWKTYPWLKSQDFSSCGFVVKKNEQIALSIPDNDNDKQGGMYFISSESEPPVKFLTSAKFPGLNFFVDDNDNFWSGGKLWTQSLNINKEEIQIDKLPISDAALIKLNKTIPGLIEVTLDLNFAFNKDTVWLGTDGMGLCKIFGDSLIHYTEKKSLPSNRINDLQIGPNGQLWVGTHNGYFKFVEGNIQNYTTDNGLLSNRCQVLHFDHRGMLWIGTSKGVHYMEGERIFAINSQDGLVADQVNCLFEDSEKRMWVGTSQGISVIDNKKVRKRNSPPKVYLENVTIDGIKMNHEDILNIPHEAQLAIYYSCIAFRNPLDVTFQYRFGADEEWINTNNRSVILQRTEEGNYHFEIRAKKPNSDWSEAQGFYFEVHPPWWRTNWFRLISTLLVGALITVTPFLWFRRNQRKKMQEAQMQHKLSRLELQALRAQMNPHFVFNALNAIMHFIMKEDKFQANIYLSKFARLMRMFLDASKSNYISLADEIELLKLYVDLEQLRFKDQFDFKLEIEESIPLESTEVPSMILQPFIENAINHGLAYKKEKGLLTLKITHHNIGQRLICLIEDDGIGRAASERIRKDSLKKHKSHATSIIKDRIKILNTAKPEHIQIVTTDLADNSGGITGTRVEVTVILDA